MAFTTKYSFNIKQDTSLAAEKQWVVDVLRLPSTVAATPTAPSNTKGPVGSSGSARSFLPFLRYPGSVCYLVRIPHPNWGHDEYLIEKPTRAFLCGAPCSRDR